MGDSLTIPTIGLLRLEVATPTATPPSGRGYHALTWQSHGHSLAAYLWRRLRQTVRLPGKCTVWRALTGQEHCLAEMTSQLGSQTVAVTSPAKSMAAVRPEKARRVGVAIGYANIQSKYW